MAKGKGFKFRPCIRCSGTVNFVLWAQETMARGQRIYHWANEDGSHHTCQEVKVQRAIDKTAGATFTRTDERGWTYSGNIIDGKEECMEIVSPAIVGENYKPDGCDCGLPPWELCRQDCGHRIMRNHTALA